MAEESFENNIENLLNHIADDNRVSGEEFAEAVEKLEVLIKDNKSYNEEMIKSLREAIKVLSESKKYIGAFKASRDDEDTLDKDTAIYALNEFLKDLKESNPELFSGKKSGGEPYSDTRVGSLLQSWFGPTRQGQDPNKEQNKMFQNLFNLMKKPNSDDEDRKTNKYLEGIKGFFSSRGFLGKLGATILGAIMDSKFLKGGLKDLIMLGVLMISSWMRKHFGPIAAGITFIAGTGLPTIIGALTGIIAAIKMLSLATKVGSFSDIAASLGGLAMMFLPSGMRRGLIKGGGRLLGGLTSKLGMTGIHEFVKETSKKMLRKEGAKVISKTATTAGTKVAGTALKGSSKFLKGIPVVGSLAAGVIDYGMAKSEGKSTGAALSNAAGGAAGALAGAAIGTAIMPGVGTIIGGILGGLAGNALGEGAYNMFSNNGGNKSNNTRQEEPRELSKLSKEISRLSDSISKQRTVTDKGSSTGVLGKIDITNAILANILTVLKHKTNYNQFGFSGVQTDIEGKPIGAWDKFKSWIGGFSSGDSNIVPTGTPNTYSSGDTSFGGHSITGSYLEGRKGYSHHGLDLAYKEGDAVGAKVAGVVKYAGVHKGTGGAHSYGGLVIITDEKGADHYYGHLSKVIAKKGQQVSQGTILGLAGNTGTSSGSHLHYEVREGAGKGAFTGEATDPMKYAREMGYNKEAEKDVFQAEEAYNKQHAAKTTKKTSNDGKASNISFKEISTSGYTYINMQGVTTFVPNGGNKK